MERALYEPGLGYYATSVERPTRAGDFLTAPELHPIFGHVLARRSTRCGRRSGGRRHSSCASSAPGTGTLFMTLLDGLRGMDSTWHGRSDYQPIDLALQRATLEQRLADGRPRRGMISDATPDSPLVGVVLANEFLDALPVHVVVREGDDLREIYVDWQDERFVERPVKCRTLD